MGYWLDEYASAQESIREQEKHNGRPLSDHPHYGDEQSAEDFSGANIIFLDIDGVMNCMGTKDYIKEYVGIDDKKVVILKEMRDMMEAEIVLVSSWKNEWYPYAKDKQDAFATILDHRLAAQGLTIADKTIDSRGANMRGFGILEWIRKQKEGVGKIVVLDDETFDYKFCGLRKYLVQTNWYDPGGGISEKHLRYLERMLPELDFVDKGVWKDPCGDEK